MSEEVEYPPSPETACRQKADRVNARLREMLDYGGVLPGHSDTIRAAIAEINNLASSYLACSADNDRLRDRCAELEKALEPFANACHYDGLEPYVVLIRNEAPYIAARATLHQGQDNG